MAGVLDVIENRGRKKQEQTPKSKNVLVAVSGNSLDADLIRLSCMMARSGRGQVYVVHVVEVPRTLPLDAQVDNTEASKVLERAVEVAESVNSEVEAEVIQAREAGPCIVDEAEDRKCSLIVMGLIPRARFGQYNLGKTVPYVLTHATCRVWVVRENATSPLSPPC